MYVSGASLQIDQPQIRFPLGRIVRLDDSEPVIGRQHHIDVRPLDAGPGEPQPVTITPDQIDELTATAEGDDTGR